MKLTDQWKDQNLDKPLFAVFAAAIKWGSGGPLLHITDTRLKRQHSINIKIDQGTWSEDKMKI